MWGGSGRPGFAGRVPLGAAPPALKSFDPPLRFQQESAVALPPPASDVKTNPAGNVYAGDLPLPILLYQRTMFVAATTQLQIVDAITGQCARRSSLSIRRTPPTRGILLTASAYRGWRQDAGPVPIRRDGAR